MITWSNRRQDCYWQTRARCSAPWTRWCIPASDVNTATNSENATVFSICKEYRYNWAVRKRVVVIHKSQLRSRVFSGLLGEFLRLHFFQMSSQIHYPTPIVTSQWFFLPDRNLLRSFRKSLHSSLVIGSKNLDNGMNSRIRNWRPYWFSFSAFRTKWPSIPFLYLNKVRVISKFSILGTYLVRQLFIWNVNTSFWSRGLISPSSCRSTEVCPILTHDRTTESYFSPIHPGTSTNFWWCNLCGPDNHSGWSMFLHIPRVDVGNGHLPVDWNHASLQTEPSIGPHIP